MADTGASRAYNWQDNSAVRELAGAVVLVIEPDIGNALTMQSALDEEGCHTHIVRGAVDAKRALVELRPSLIVTELLLPDGDGLLLCAHLRSHSDAALVICTTQNEKRERTLAYHLGVDDFIAKPYDVEELLVRLDAAVRRAAERTALHAALSAPLREAEPNPDGTAVAGLSVHRTFPEATYRGSRLALTPTEHRLLSVFLSRPNQTITREELVALISGCEYVPGSRSVDMHVRRLRAKLALAHVEGVRLVSVRGAGYRLVAIAERHAPQDPGARIPWARAS